MRGINQTFLNCLLDDLELVGVGDRFLPGGLVRPLTNPQKDKRVELYSRHRNILAFPAPKPRLALHETMQSRA